MIKTGKWIRLVSTDNDTLFDFILVICISIAVGVRFDIQIGVIIFGLMTLFYRK